MKLTVAAQTSARTAVALERSTTGQPKLKQRANVDGGSRELYKDRAAVLNACSTAIWEMACCTTFPSQLRRQATIHWLPGLCRTPICPCLQDCSSESTYSTLRRAPKGYIYKMAGLSQIEPCWILHIKVADTRTNHTAGFCLVHATPGRAHTARMYILIIFVSVFLIGYTARM